MRPKPAASVTAETAESVAPAPVEGAAKVTVTPGTGLASKSRTITRKGEPNCTPFTAVCSVPVETAIVAGGSAAFVREKDGGGKPPIVAVTLKLPAS